MALILDDKISREENVSKFFKGVFRLKPPKPKYDRIWNIDIVLLKVSEWFPNESLSFEKLTLKLVILLAIGSTRRMQTLAAIKVSDIKLTRSGYEIEISSIIKTSRPGAFQPLISLPYLKDKPKLCVASILGNYLRVTMLLRKGWDSLLLTIRNPHRKASKDTISRWVRSILASCNIRGDFTAHSTRHAASSAALKKGVSLRAICRAAGWSEESRVFAQAL